MKLKILFFLYDLMKHFLLLSLIILLGVGSSLAQQPCQTIVLQSGSKTIRLYLKHAGSFNLILNMERDSAKCSQRIIKGMLVSASPDEIKYVPSHENLQMFFPDHSVQKTEFFYPPDSPPKSIMTADICYLGYKSKQANNCTVAGGILAGIGAFTALVVAPLVFLENSSYSANMHRYYQVSLSGIGLCIVSIPFLIFSREKKFYLHPQNKKNEVLWKIIR